MGSRRAIGDEHVRHSTTTRHIPSQTPHGECPACAYSSASLTIKCSALCGSGASGACAWRCDAAMETRHAIRAASPCRSRSKSILPGSVHTNPASRHGARLPRLMDTPTRGFWINTSQHLVDGRHGFALFCMFECRPWQKAPAPIACPFLTNHVTSFRKLPLSMSIEKSATLAASPSGD